MNMLGARLLPLVLLAVTALNGCSLIPPYASCEGTGAALAELDALPVLALRPARAVPVEGGTATTAHCVDDTAGAWLDARRLYAYDGSREEVLEYYAREAPAAGWRPPGRFAEARTLGFSVFCFESREQPSLTLAFERPEQLRELDGLQLDPGPGGPGSRIWFSLSVEAETDGSRMDC
ncbi:hypothetical protein DEJ51_06570 [Streptomyces venezuelae]|uniref:Lipoprotein n=1 Tax=Streptomyces venezuelae TaxID=54571 RepID=A0A5P2DFK5_STRVZ|nr:hypothetical protein [Streptomyces venezuelae]QES53955.1 hypothetical protein DEJ51_06570 [Streptomyces venezuelae]